MAGSSDPGFDTLALHAGAAPDPATGARAVPIHLSTSFVFRSSEHAAAHQQERVHLGTRTGCAQGRFERSGRLRTLHGAGVDHHAHMRRPPLQRDEHIAQGRRCGGRDHAHRPGIGHQRAFAIGIEQTFSSGGEVLPPGALKIEPMRWPVIWAKRFAGRSSSAQ